MRYIICLLISLFSYSVYSTGEYIYEQLKNRAESDDTFAKIEHAKALWESDAGQESQDQAVSLFQEVCDDEVSTNKEKMDAHFCIGMIFYIHVKEEQCLKKAFQHFERSVELGGTGALVCMGLMYSKGYHVDKDEKKAFNLFHEASKSEVPEAFNNLGLCYALAKGTEKNIELAKENYTKAIELGVCEAYINMAVMIFQNSNLIGEKREGFELLQQAAEFGNGRAYCIIGNSYVKGRVVEMNLEKAVANYEKALSLGFTSAQSYLDNAKLKISNMKANSKKISSEDYQDGLLTEQSPSNELPNDIVAAVSE